MLFLVGITLAGSLVLTQPVFPQSDPLLGIWQLNVAKSKYSPGPPPKSQTWYIWDDEKTRKNSQVTIRADGVPEAVVIIHTYDDVPRPVPGQRTYDASAYRRVDDRTVSARYLQAGKLTATASWSVSQDGKTLTYTGTGIDQNGREVSQLRIYEKQQ
jgi:hypothetical protein